jgi:malate dehydrogenase (oxaloacetate-decarboxylating)
VPLTPSAQYSLTIRMEIEHKPGMLGRVASAIGQAGGTIGAVDLISVDDNHTVRDITVAAGDQSHWEAIVAAIEECDGASVIDTTDQTFLLHVGGKIEQRNKHPLRTRDDLSMAYTPGVARVCKAIEADPKKAFQYTIKRNTVAVVSDGTAVLGLGDIGPEAAMPVMEGKAMLFKEFAGVDAFPVCLATKEPDEIVRTVELIAPAFGGINLEDIAAPRCFEIEERLKVALDIPVFHDDQHGTAIVVLAALTNALRCVEKKLPEARIVVSGGGAAGSAIVTLLLAGGAVDVMVNDREGILCAGDESLSPAMADLAARTNPHRVRGGLHDALRGADVFIGVSAPGILPAEWIADMAPKSVVFALANPDPEVDPADAEKYAAVVASGRSDFPNQINNVLAFPGLFRGLLDARATEITTEMLLKAAEAIALVVKDDELNPNFIIPSVFNADVPKAVAAAIRGAE